MGSASDSCSSAAVGRYLQRRDTVSAYRTLPQENRRDDLFMILRNYQKILLLMSE